MTKALKKKSNDEKKCIAIGALASAESDYLTACGWFPMTPRNGVVQYSLNNGPMRYLQDAVTYQKHLDKALWDEFR